MRIGTFQAHLDEMCRQRGITLEEAAAKVLELGIENVCVAAGWNKSPEEERKRLNGVGLKITDAFGMIKFISGDSVNSDIEALVARADILGVERLQVCTDAFRDSSDHQKCREDDDRVVQGLNYCVKLATERGIAIVIEDYDVNDGPMTYGAHMKYLLENTEKVGFAFDSGNFVHAGEDEIENLESLLPWLAHAHFKDRSRHLCRPDEQITSPYATLDHTTLYPCPVGAGFIRFDQILSIFRRAGYEGMVLLEHFNSPDQYSYLEQSAAFAKKYIL